MGREMSGLEKGFGLLIGGASVVGILFASVRYSIKAWPIFVECMRGIEGWLWVGGMLAMLMGVALFLHGINGEEE